jgi:citrate synthase
MTPWRTAIVHAHENSIRLRGYDITELMEKASFADVAFLLHQGRLPSAHESRIFNAILIASADHGAGAPSCATARLAASGNRQSFSAAVAAGVLAIGDNHGGAGARCMELIAEGAALAKQEGIPIEEAAQRVYQQLLARGERVSGFGHRVHSTDPRVDVMFRLASEAGAEPGEGVRFVRAIEKLLAAKTKPIPINVDGALAALLHDLGFEPRAGMFLFIIGRVVGLTAEVNEEYTREKPMRIKVPVEYDGEGPRSL